MTECGYLAGTVGFDGDNVLRCNALASPVFGEVSIVLSNSFGFGGQMSLIFGRS